MPTWQKHCQGTLEAIEADRKNQRQLFLGSCLMALPVQALVSGILDITKPRFPGRH